MLRSIWARSGSAGLVAAGEQVPDPTAEIGTAEQGVRDHANEQQHGDDIAEAHDETVCVGADSVGSPAGGPYGVGRSMSVLSRQRRAIERNTLAAVTPIAV